MLSLLCHLKLTKSTLQTITVTDHKIHCCDFIKQRYKSRSSSHLPGREELRQVSHNKDTGNRLWSLQNKNAISHLRKMTLRRAAHMGGLVWTFRNWVNICCIKVDILYVAVLPPLVMTCINTWITFRGTLQCILWDTLFVWQLNSWFSIFHVATRKMGVYFEGPDRKSYVTFDVTWHQWYRRQRRCLAPQPRLKYHLGGESPYLPRCVWSQARQGSVTPGLLRCPEDVSLSVCVCHIAGEPYWNWPGRSFILHVSNLLLNACALGEQSETNRSYAKLH